ncbi:Retrotransposon Gag-like protein 9 [Labeo rohita]|uniref:Retrotransposon Gag-like protein 9 n=1 Tax=Labeo rohita TaxID=84645 RepID=A0ABQ8L7Z0_LABRO|nr:Retrotransposon Gag-like protein 9 [Labeo rohita]
MDTASRLFHLCQGNRCIEDYVVDFCGLCHHLVAFNDVALKDIFRYGLNEPICSQLPGGKIHWTLEQYIDFALLLAGSLFTVGVADEQPCNPTVPTTPKPTHVMSSKPKPAHTMPAKPAPALVMAALPESAPVVAALPESAPVVAALLESAPVMAALPESAPVVAALPESAPVVAALLESAPVMAALPEPV